MHYYAAVRAPTAALDASLLSFVTTHPCSRTPPASRCEPPAQGTPRSWPWRWMLRDCDGPLGYDPKRPGAGA